MVKQIFVLLVSILFVGVSEAQIIKVSDNIKKETEQSTKSDSIHKSDSTVVQELLAQINDMKMRELLLLDKIKTSKNSTINDSLAESEKRRRIDSLRTTTVGTPVFIDKDTLFYLYAQLGGHTPQSRATDIENNIIKIGKERNLEPDSIEILNIDNISEIMYHQMVIMSIGDNDALWLNKNRMELATEYRDIIVKELTHIKEQNNLFHFIRRILSFILIIVAQYFMIKGVAILFRRTKKKIEALKDTKLKPFKIKDYEVLDVEREVTILIFFAMIIKYIINIIQLMITIPILFSIFPKTEYLARQIFNYILIPVKKIGVGIVEYIPNLFTILIIIICIRYVIRGFKFMANEIANEHLKLPGFYPDWAHPTFNILKFLLNAFMIAMIYPYLPGSDSDIFKGVSVFVGIIFSLGSSTVIGNIMAGLVITYMRPFKLGDRIKLNETVGNVIEKSPFVVRIKTIKNEVVTVPNSFIMSSHIINYSTSANVHGLIIHSTVTIGYDAPWRTVHALLIAAAKATDGIMAEPEPFVLQTELSDFYPVYQINAYISEANRSAQIYSDLHKNIQDKFNEAGVEIMSPHYRAERDGNAITIPAEYKK